MEITADEAREYVLYQIGALQAFARADKVRLQHVKPHGALWSLGAKNEAVAAGLVEGIKAIDPELIFLGRPGQLSYELAKEVGLRTAIDIGADMNYRADLTVVLERHRAPAEPKDIARRVAKMIEEERVETVEGRSVDLKIDSLAVHGDTPNAIDVVLAIRGVLLERECEIVPLGSFI
jgi:UPF0271 protein